MTTAATMDAKPRTTPHAKPRPMTTAEAQPRLYSVKQLAALLGCSRRTVDYMRADGRLPAPDCRVGTMARWKAETVNAWIERGGR